VINQVSRVGQSCYISFVWVVCSSYDAEWGSELDWRISSISMIGIAACI
jgi:hypothetical protein